MTSADHVCLHLRQTANGCLVRVCLILISTCTFIKCGRSFITGWAVFEGWNQLDFLPDRFTSTAATHEPNEFDPATDPRARYVISRCWLEIDAIVQRLRALKKEYTGELKLKQVYVSTNGKEEWVGQLKRALMKDGWDKVMTTRDLKLSWEESGVDSAIGEFFCSLGYTNECAD